MRFGLALLMITVAAGCETHGVDWVSRISGISGLVFGLLGATFSIINHLWDRKKFAMLERHRLEDKEERRREKEEEERKKEEQRRPRVKATVGVSVVAGRRPAMTVELVNLSEFPINIDKVQIESRDGDRTLGIPLYCFVQSPAAGRLLPVNGCKLEPHGTKAVFYLEQMPEQLLKMLLTLPASELWIAIHSTDREIERTNGEPVLEFLKQLSHVPSFAK